MKNLFTLVILLCPALYGWADEENTAKKATDAHITGHIILKETGEHLPFMTILLKGTNIGTATDETGHFFLKNLPEGKYTLRVQGVGYKSAEKEIVIVKGKTQEVNFEISEDAVLLDGAVVTANRNETDRREAPVIVNVLSPKVFENTNSVCLSQGLNFQPGLRVENNCQNCGFQQVRINGLDGPYSQILIDSRPMCSSLAGSVRLGTNTRQHGRTSRGTTGWRLCPLRIKRHSRNNQHHHARTLVQLFPSRAYPFRH